VTLVVADVAGVAVRRGVSVREAAGGGMEAGDQTSPMRLHHNAQLLKKVECMCLLEGL
jgi:hypothetical protein